MSPTPPRRRSNSTSNLPFYGHSALASVRPGAYLAGQGKEQSQMSAINTSTLRPGLLVGLSTSISGNVRYRTQTLEEEHLTEDGAEAARWETERTITDPAEYEAAKKARSKARNSIVRVCAASAFGLLCPED